MDSPVGSRRGTFRDYSPTARQRRKQLLEVQQDLERFSICEDAIDEEPPTQPGSAPVPERRPQSRYRPSSPPRRRYRPVGFAPQVNKNLTRNTSMNSMLRYFNRDRFDQRDLSRVATAAQSKGQSPGSMHSPENVKSPPDRDSHVRQESAAAQHISYQNVIYEVRPGSCPHCSGHSYIPLRLASQPRMPGSWDESHHPDSDIINEDLSQLLTALSIQLIQHHQLCPRYRSKGRADWHWEDRRPMWLPQLSENFTLYKSDSVQYPRDLWRDYEVSRAWSQGRKAVVRRYLGEPHHEIADIPAAVSADGDGDDEEKPKEKGKKFSVEDLDK